MLIWKRFGVMQPMGLRRVVTTEAIKGLAGREAQPVWTIGMSETVRLVIDKRETLDMAWVDLVEDIDGIFEEIKEKRRDSGYHSVYGDEMTEEEYAEEQARNMPDWVKDAFMYVVLESFIIPLGNVSRAAHEILPELAIMLTQSSIASTATAGSGATRSGSSCPSPSSASTCSSFGP